MKLFYIGIFYKNQDQETCHIKLLKSASELSSFGFFQRSSIEEFMKITSKVILERTEVNTRTSIKENEYMAHVYMREDKLSGVLISDHEYDHRVAHLIINKTLQDFSEVVSSDTWDKTKERGAPYTGLLSILTKYQNPKETDGLLKLQANLDETRIVLLETLDTVLKRGEKIDDLILRSEEMSVDAKVFYKTCRKANSCCSYMG